MNSSDFKSLEIAFAGRHDTIKSVHDVERKYMILKGTTRLSENDKRIIQEYYDEILRIRELEGEL